MNFKNKNSLSLKITDRIEIFGANVLIRLFIHCESKKTKHQTLAHNFTKY